MTCRCISSERHYRPPTQTQYGVRSVETGTILWPSDGELGTKEWAQELVIRYNYASMAKVAEVVSREVGVIISEVW